MRTQPASKQEPEVHKNPKHRISTFSVTSSVENLLEADEGLREAKEGLSDSKEGLRDADDGLRDVKEGLRIADEDLRDAMMLSVTKRHGY